MLLLMGLIVFITGCSDNHPSKDSGDDQVPLPVQNSGPQTEAERANKAVKDSALHNGMDTLNSGH